MQRARTQALGRAGESRGGGGRKTLGTKGVKDTTSAQPAELTKLGAHRD